MQRRVARPLGALAAMGLAVAVGCSTSVTEIRPEAATPPGAAAAPSAPAAAPPGSKADLKRALSEPMPMHDQRPPWQVFFESNFYHETTLLAHRVWRTSMILGSTYLPQIFSEPAEERESNPLLKAKAARVEERREAHREAQARRNKRHR